MGIPKQIPDQRFKEVGEQFLERVKGLTPIGVVDFLRSETALGKNIDLNLLVAAMVRVFRERKVYDADELFAYEKLAIKAHVLNRLVKGGEGELYEEGRAATNKRDAEFKRLTGTE